jgi:hypothetical protein
MWLHELIACTSGVSWRMGTHETYVTYGKLKPERCAQALTANRKRPTANRELFTV